jgi:hypothetical protein
LRIAFLIAGMVGCGGAPSILFFPSRCFEAAGLEECVGDYPRVSMVRALREDEPER